MLKNNHSRNFGGEGGNVNLEKSRLDWVFQNEGLPKYEVSKMPHFVCLLGILAAQPISSLLFMVLAPQGWSGLVLGQA